MVLTEANLMAMIKTAMKEKAPMMFRELTDQRTLDSFVRQRAQEALELELELRSQAITATATGNLSAMEQMQEGYRLAREAREEAIRQATEFPIEDVHEVSLWDEIHAACGEVRQCEREGCENDGFERLGSILDQIVSEYDTDDPELQMYMFCDDLEERYYDLEVGAISPYLARFFNERAANVYNSPKEPPTASKSATPVKFRPLSPEKAKKIRDEMINALKESNQEEAALFARRENPSA